jgi:hypothetical protein
MSTREALWARLSEAGLVTGEMPAVGEGRAPWYVRVMQGIGGWIGALFLLGFVGAGFAFVMESKVASVVVGALACAAAVAIFRAARDSDFMDQFGFAVSLAGQALLAFGLAEGIGRSLAGIALVVSVQQALLFMLVPNFMHRVWTAWSGAFALSLTMLDLGLHAFTPAAVTAAFLWVSISEFDLARYGAPARAGAYGLALAAVPTAVLGGDLWVAWLWDRGGYPVLGGLYGAWAGRLALAAVPLLAVLKLLAREGLAPLSAEGRIGLAGALILGAASIEAPGVAPAVAILVAGFANANRVLAGLGVLSLLVYLSHYYYSLQATLLDKSGLLAATGIALLAARFAMRRLWPEGPADA